MARSFEMSWIASRSRWMKMYKGKRFVISCKALGMPENKEGSYLAANEWWRKKRTELDGKDTGRVERVARLADALIKLDVEEASRQASLELLRMAKDASPEIQEAVATRVASARNTLQPFLQPVPTDQSIAAHAELWHKHQQALVAADQMSPDRASNNRTCLDHFQAFAGPTSDVKTITGPTLHNFYGHCIGQVSARRRNPEEGWSVAYARDVFSVAKGFIRFLAMADTIPMPKNIGSKAFKFGKGHKAIQTWTVEEFKLAVKEAPAS